MSSIACQANEPVSPSVLNEPDTDAAKRRFKRGVTLFDQERYAEAAVEFEAAKRLKPSPAFDFNIGRCYDRMEKWGNAADAYQRYLDGTPNAPEATELYLRIATLRERVAGTAATSAPPLGAPEKPRARRWWVWAIVGAGAAAAVGIGLGVGLTVGRSRDSTPATTDGKFEVTFP